MNIRRPIVIAGAVAAILLLLVCCIIVSVLGSDRGTHWSLRLLQKLAPEISIEHVSGTWLQGLHTDVLRWRNDDVDIVIDDLNIRVWWPALLHGQLQLASFNAQRFSLHNLGASNDTPVQLPRLALPFTLSAPQLTLQKLIIVNTDSSVILSNLRTAVSWSGTTLRLQQAQLSWEDFQLSATGSLSFRDDYPLQLQGELRMPQVAAPIAVISSGDLRSLQLRAITTAPLPAHADITLAILDTNMPLTAHVTLPPTDTMLLPEIPVIAHSGTLDLKGDLTRIDGTLELAIAEPHYGDSKFTATLQWQPQQLHAALQLVLASGDLHSDCAFALTDSIAWTCTGTANTIPLGPLLPQISATLSGPIQLEGAWRAQQLSIALDLPTLSGQLGADAITGQLKLRSEDGELWQLPQFALNAGPNRLQAKGEFGVHNRLQIDLQAADLSRFNTELSGVLSAALAIDGDWPEPALSGQLSGSRLRYQAFAAAQINAEFALPRLALENSSARIDLQQLAIGTQAPIDATLTANGNRVQQRSVLALRQQKNRLNLDCATKSTQSYQDWEFNCGTAQASIHLGDHSSEWRANSTLHGVWQTSTQQFDLAPFCLSADDATLCLDSALRIIQQRVQTFSAHGQALPLSWASAWLPETLTLDNDARANLQIAVKNAAPLQANALLKIPHTLWSWPLADKKQQAEINDINFALQLDEHNAQFDGSAHSPTIGSIATHLIVHDPRGSRGLDGNIELQHIELAGLAWLVEGLDAISGQLNGAIQLNGSAAAPLLHGQLLLQDGTANWAPLGAPFRNVHVNLDFDNNNAKIGGWFALGQGGGDIDGNASWDGAGDNWRVQLGLIAGGISAAPLPQSTIVFSPHIDLTAAPSELHAKGYVDIASAEIFLKELPPQTIDVSQDTHIVGQQIPADTWKIWADIGLNLGEQFHFQGLGADVNLTGRLRLQQEPGDVAHLTGEVYVPKGRYRAYGQRLTVRRGSFIFYGPWNNPDLNLEAVRDMPPGVTDVVGLRIIGSLKTPEALLFSEPSLPDSDIAYYLLTGRKPSTSSTANQFSASGALLSLGLSGSEDRASKLAQKFGITDLQLGTAQGVNGSEAELSGQLSQDLYVRYGRGLGQSSNSITFQYKLTPKLLIETTSGIENALDLLYSFNIK